MYHMSALCSWNSEEGAGFPRFGVTDTCKPSHGCWVLNPGPLQEQPVLLTTELSLHPKTAFLNPLFETGKGEQESWTVAL